MQEIAARLEDHGLAVAGWAGVELHLVLAAMAIPNLLGARMGPIDLVTPRHGEPSTDESTVIAIGRGEPAAAESPSIC
jgi:hypothetical protein